MFGGMDSDDTEEEEAEIIEVPPPALPPATRS